MTVINTNIKSLVARDALAVNNRQLATAMERLSTGKRINSAADDAAGLSISTRMDSQVRGLQMAVKNSNDAISVTQTAEGAMQEINNILQRMRELAVQSSNDSNSADDRAFLQAEVSQLSDEIDRIATTTQFNGINVLDGGFQNKTFQIGANNGQTMKISVGDMRSSALGVASSEIQLASTPSTSTSSESVVTVKATGVAATPTEARLIFGANTSAGDESASLTVVDSVSGLSATVTAVLDINDEYSKGDFLDELNKALAQSGTQTSLTGAATAADQSAAAEFIADITDADNFDSLKFAIQLDAGEPVQNIDLRQRLASNGVTSAATYTQIVTAMQQELRSVFADDNASISVAYGTAVGFTVSDLEGRSIEISQGAGDGLLFGTDSDNGGALSVEENIRNNITASWDGNAIVLTNAAGGDVTVDDVAFAGSTVTFDASAGQETQIDPVVYGSADVSSISSANGNTARYVGNVEPSQMAITFSNTEGSAGGTTANYTFDLTNGDGDVYGAVTVNVHSSESNASVVATVISALTAGLAANFADDDTFDISEFDVAFDGNTLTITNSAGRALAVENFSSEVGAITVTPMNELGATETLASKNALFSTTRIGVNTGFFGMSAAAGATAGALLLTIDGRSIGGGSASAIPITVDGSITSGDALASAIAAAISAATDTYMSIDGADVSAVIDLTTLNVAYDADTNEIVISDSKGRAIGFGLHADNGLAGTGLLFEQDFVKGTDASGYAVKRDSAKVQGDVLESTKVTLTLNATDEVTFNFAVNGTSLGSTTYDPSENFASSDLKSNLDAMMLTLNSVHPDNVFEYAVSGAKITIWQRDGGEVAISDFTTSGVGDDALTMTIAGAEGQGDTVVAYETDVTASTESSTASGVLAQRTEATMTLSADDAYSMVISNGVTDYTFSSHVVDLSDTTSVQNFTAAMEEALDGSGIAVSMDTNGKVYFSRADGGEIGLKSFTSASGNAATWTPKAGQGDASALAGDGSLLTTVTSTASSTSTVETTSIGGGTVAVSQISVASQEDAAAALDVLDDALTYVNSERSKLGAIENRLTHTIDNLTNVITNTEASRSRIVDADYAAETSELARTQIIQQAATAMLAQANQSSQSVLSLLQ